MFAVWGETILRLYEIEKAEEEANAQSPSRTKSWRTEARAAADTAAERRGGRSGHGGDTMSAAERQRRLELRALLNKKYKWIDRKWDLVFWITAIFVVAGAADITKQLFAGDWDFWTDWKDPQWWPVVTAFATIIIPSALQYIQWVAWRFPTGATYTAVCFFMAAWVGRYLSVARRRELSAEFRLADLHRLRRRSSWIGC